MTTQIFILTIFLYKKYILLNVLFESGLAQPRRMKQWRNNNNNMSEEISVSALKILIFSATPIEHGNPPRMAFLESHTSVPTPRKRPRTLLDLRLRVCCDVL